MGMRSSRFPRYEQRTSKYRDLMTTIVPKHKVSILYTPLNTPFGHLFKGVHGKALKKEYFK